MRSSGVLFIGVLLAFTATLNWAVPVPVFVPAEESGGSSKLDGKLGDSSFDPEANRTIDWNPTLMFLMGQLWGGIPHSYQVDDQYWFTPAYLNDSQHSHPIDGMVAIQDRTCTKFGLNLYDGAVWELALALDGEFELQQTYENQVLYCSTTGRDDGIGVKDLRADSDDFQYGVQGLSGKSLEQVLLPGNCTNPSDDHSNKMPGALFFRMISNTYRLTDPIMGNYAQSFIYNQSNSTSPSGPSWNVHGQIIWNDWKPIMGENVWGAILAPIQLLYMEHNGSLPTFQTYESAPDRILMALSILPALKALQSPSGAIYHCPNGSLLFPVDPEESTNVSNENNFSALAALKMLMFALNNMTKGSTDAHIVQAKTDVQDLLNGIDKYFKADGLSPPLNGTGRKVFYQGGHAPFAGGFNPVPLTDSQGFAVDCQTWGMTALGGKYVDDLGGEGTAYQIWQETKARSGFLDAGGVLRGVGYTDHPKHDVWSSEWSFGAVLMTRKLAEYYKSTGKTQWANDLLTDAGTMDEGLQWGLDQGGLKTKEGAFIYCNSNFFIPWGWFAHAIPSTAGSGWSVFNKYKFNPFQLGGGLSWLPTPPDIPPFV